VAARVQPAVVARVQQAVVARVQQAEMARVQPALAARVLSGCDGQGLASCCGQGSAGCGRPGHGGMGSCGEGGVEHRSPGLTEATTSRAGLLCYSHHCMIRRPHATHQPIPLPPGSDAAHPPNCSCWQHNHPAAPTGCNPHFSLVPWYIASAKPVGLPSPLAVVFLNPQ